MRERQLFAQRREVRDHVVQPREPGDHQQLAPPARTLDRHRRNGFRVDRSSVVRPPAHEGALGCARGGQVPDVIQQRNQNRVRDQSSAAWMPLLGKHVEHARQCEHHAPPRVRGAVVVGVVEQQHGALLQTSGHARGDRLGGGALLPVAPPMGPQERAPASAPREAQSAGVEHPVGRTIQRGRDPGGVLDRRLRAREVLANLPRGEAQQVAMAVAVQADRVTGRHDLRRASRGCAAPARRRGRTSRCTPRDASDVEHGRRPLRVRAIVERERPAAPAGGAILDPERAAQRGPDRRRRARKAGRPRAGKRRQRVAGHRHSRSPRSANRGGWAAMIVGVNARSHPGNRWRRWPPRRSTA